MTTGEEAVRNMVLDVRQTEAMRITQQIVNAPIRVGGDTTDSLKLLEDVMTTTLLYVAADGQAENILRLLTKTVRKRIKTASEELAKQGALEA